MMLGRILAPEPKVYHDDAYEGEWAVLDVHCYACANIFRAICPADAEALRCPRCLSFTLLVDEATNGG